MQCLSTNPMVIVKQAIESGIVFTMITFGHHHDDNMYVPPKTCYIYT